MVPPILNFSGESDRDVFNEKPSREEILAATQVNGFLFNDNVQKNLPEFC